jgi:hypothetical protein
MRYKRRNNIRVNYWGCDDCSITITNASLKDISDHLEIHKKEIGVLNLAKNK